MYVDDPYVAGYVEELCKCETCLVRDYPVIHLNSAIIIIVPDLCRDHFLWPKEVVAIDRFHSIGGMSDSQHV